ncbi:hypothetical protein Ahy_B01g054293 isoform B [Arachis hypogaea]|uniref:Uncharacterized protein n=1 Tax=Arachis hypogaea TaxID=3818 RepID=A0A445ATP2_ARAHY|nr:hypothetical protein Ahy_B01g054293 isoform B [Arachis hypogaea]
MIRIPAFDKLGNAGGALVETCPSGCLTLDCALGGGLPKGRIAEFDNMMNLLTFTTTALPNPKSRASHQHQNTFTMCPAPPVKKHKPFLTLIFFSFSISSVPSSPRCTTSTPRLWYVMPSPQLCCVAPPPRRAPLLLFPPLLSCAPRRAPLLLVPPQLHPSLLDSISIITIGTGDLCSNHGVKMFTEELNSFSGRQWVMGFMVSALTEQTNIVCEKMIRIPAFYKLGNAGGALVETFLSGCLTLDCALGGNLPKGRIVEFFPPSYLQLLVYLFPIFVFVSLCTLTCVYQSSYVVLNLYRRLLILFITLCLNCSVMVKLTLSSGYTSRYLDQKVVGRLPLHFMLLQKCSYRMNSYLTNVQFKISYYLFLCCCYLLESHLYVYENQVLNACKNKLRSMDEVRSLVSLRALILKVDNLEFERKSSKKKKKTVDDFKKEVRVTDEENTDHNKKSTKKKLKNDDKPTDKKLALQENVIRIEKKHKKKQKNEKQSELDTINKIYFLFLKFDKNFKNT